MCIYQFLILFALYVSFVAINTVKLLNAYVCNLVTKNKRQDINVMQIPKMQINSMCMNIFALCSLSTVCIHWKIKCDNFFWLQLTEQKYWPAGETDTIHEEMLNVFFYNLSHVCNTNRSKHFVHLATIIRAPHLFFLPNLQSETIHLPFYRILRNIRRRRSTTSLSAGGG